MKYLHLILFFIASFTAYGQDTLDTDYGRLTTTWKQIAPEDLPARITGSGWQRIIVESTDTSTYIYTITRRKKVWSLPPEQPIVVQAKNFVAQQGVTPATDYIGSTDAGDYVAYSVPLSGVTKMKVDYSRQWTGEGSAEVRAGSLTGPVIGTLTTANTGSWTTFSTTQIPLKPSTATTVYILFKAEGTGNIKTFTFE